MAVELRQEHEHEDSEFNILNKLSQVHSSLEASRNTLLGLAQNNNQSHNIVSRLSKPECMESEATYYDWGSLRGGDKEAAVGSAKYLPEPAGLESHFIQVLERLQKLEEALKRMQLASESFDQLSSSGVAEDSDGMHENIQYLPFFLGDELFAVNINTVTEVLEADKLISSSGPGKNRKAINLRGSLVPIIDLNLYLGGISSQVSRSTLLLILEVDTSEHLQVVGVKVDGVGKILNIGTSSIEPPHDQKDSLCSGFVIGTLSTDYHCVTLLDISQGLLLNSFPRKEASVKGHDSHLKANVMSIHDSIL